MKTTTITRILVAFALVGLPACDGGDTKKTDTKVVAKTVQPKIVEPKITTPEPEKPAEKDQAADPNAEKIKLAAIVAREISGAPEQADEILGKHGLDRDKLDSLMFEIASDPDLTQQYMNARRNS